MIYNLAHDGIKLITFTIDGVTYQAEPGMTWEEWVNSKYNTDGYLVLNTAATKLVATSGSNTVEGKSIQTAGTVHPTDKIIAGERYSLKEYDYS